ncbi:hypothetical protein ACFE04_031377 [Oxalis oulophora]
MSIFHQMELPIRHSQRFKASVTPLPIGEEDDSSPNNDDVIISEENLLIDISAQLKLSSLFLLSFNNLTYTIKPSSGMIKFPFIRKSKLDSEAKVLLNAVSGIAREGEIMAILGASGAGKSTLLDALAGRIAKQSLKGSISLNGEDVLDKNSSLLKSISAYVMQDDLFFPMLTVEETLMYSAEFRLPRSFSKSKKKARVHALIEQLGLQAATNTMIGDEGHRGVSGGERRRVSIGVDIIHDPILLFLDEPTSGLDSTSAFKVVQVLQKIAKSGSIVITSMHQPSYRVLSILDRLIFLSRGKIAYYGSPENLSKFFFDFGHPVPLHDNPSEFVLDLVRELEDNNGITSLVEFNKSWEKKNVNSTLGNYVPLSDAISKSISKGKLVSDAESSTSSVSTTFANPFWVEIPIIAKRLLTNSRRMPDAIKYRSFSVILTGLMLISLFWKASDTPQGVRSKLSFFTFVIFYSLYTFVEELPAFIQEKYIFIRETNYNSYRKSSYVLARSIISLPSFIIFALIFSSITFWPIGLGGGVSGFFFFYYVIMASFWAGSSFVMFIAGIVSNAMAGYILLFTLMCYHILLSGFYIHRSEIPVYWLWLHYSSLVKYPYEAVLRNEFDNDPSRCYVKGIQVFDNTPIGNISMGMKEKLLKALGNVLGLKITGSTCVNTGTNILEQEGVTELSKWDCLWITIAWGFLFQILFYVCARLNGKNKRR